MVRRPAHIALLGVLWKRDADKTDLQIVPSARQCNLTWSDVGGVLPYWVHNVEDWAEKRQEQFVKCLCAMKSSSWQNVHFCFLLHKGLLWRWKLPEGLDFHQKYSCEKAFWQHRNRNLYHKAKFVSTEITNFYHQTTSTLVPMTLLLLGRMTLLHLTFLTVSSTHDDLSVE